jgi:hypothetical protein
MKGLIIREPYAGQILSGAKTEEIRGCATKIRGTIAVIPAGTLTVAGTVDIVDCRGPFRARLGYKNAYKYILKSPKKFKKPVPYKHKSGAVRWVNLDGVNL